MAKKSAAALKSSPVKIHSRDAKMIAAIEKKGTPPGTEEAFAMYLRSVIKNAEAYARMDALGKVVEKGKGAGSHTHPEWGNFMDALNSYATATGNEMRSLDHWMNTVKHMNDAKYASIEDLRAVIKDSLSDKTDGLVFHINHGLLGSQIATTLRTLAVEAESGDIPLCRDCQG